MTHPARRIIGHYEHHATAWDADRQNSAWNDKVWHDRFIARLTHGATVLDLGCGSGRPVAWHMARQGLRVTGRRITDRSGLEVNEHLANDRRAGGRTVWLCRRPADT